MGVRQSGGLGRVAVTQLKLGNGLCITSLEDSLLVILSLLRLDHMRLSHEAK